MRTYVETVILALLAVGLLYVERAQLQLAYHALYDRAFPCTRPIAYSVGAYDSRFGISEGQFTEAIVEAEAIWEKAVDKDLFVYTGTGALKINLVYDYRQEATDKLAKLGLVVKDDRASYDVLKAKHDSLDTAYVAKKAAYEAAVSDFTRRRDAYDAQVQDWNRRGGAPRTVYAQLQEEKVALASKLEGIRSMEVDLKDRVGTINALVEELNRLATTLNITASQFNQIGSARGEEFTEGLYSSSSDGERIDIYQFDTKEKLVRVLAHELGHALSLEHVDDPKAIMYRLNQGATQSLTSADIEALKTLCRIK